MNTLPIIPDHVLLRPIGRGAYGEVWLARNIMGALRAVKIIWRRHFESARPYEREFAGIQRYEPVSRSSGGLVHVLHVGRNDADGYFYYVMELADDSLNAEFHAPSPIALPDREQPGIQKAKLETYSPRTLRSDLKRLGSIPTTDCIRVAIDVVGGLAQLHQHALVHRDVKPGNIIFVHGRAKLADIGLVSAGGEERTFVGTEGYIPPEGPGSPAADLYALGVVLYEASTGFSPDRFPDVPTQWFREGAEDDSLELHEVILKACEGQRERRYQSAEELQADLALLQSGQSVRRVRALERRVKLFRRLGLAATLIVVTAVLGALFAGWRARVAQQMSARESALRARAETAENDARQKLYNAYLAQARATVLSGDAGRRFQTLEAVRQAAALHSTPELRREALAALALPDLRVERDIDIGARRNNAWIDPTFTRYAVSLRRDAVEIRALSDQRLLQTLPASTNLNAQVLRFSANGRYLAFKRDHTYGDDSDLEVWDLAATQRVVLARHAVANHAISFHPTAPRLLAGRPSGRLVTWDLEHGTEIKSWRLPPHWVVTYSPEGSRFAISYSKGRSNVVEIRDATNSAVLASASFPDVVTCLPWHPSGDYIAVPCADSSVSVMDAHDGTVRLLGKHKAQAVSADFSPDGDFVFSGGWDGELNIWNLRSHQRELTAPLGGPNPQINDRGDRLALFAKDRLQILEFSRPTECRELAGELRFGARHGQFSADGRWLAIPTINGVAVWDLQCRGPAGLFTQAGQGAAVFSPSADELFGFSDRKLFRWRLTRGENKNPPGLQPLPVFPVKAPVYSLHLLRQRAALLISDAEGIRVVSLTNVTTGKGERTRWPFGRVTVSADEKLLAAAFDRQRYIRIFSIFNLTSAQFLLTNPAPVRSLTFAPDGKSLTVVSDALLTTWDTKTWKVVRERSVDARSEAFVAADYTPDGRILLLRETARSGALLDAHTLEPLLPLPVWRQPLALSADGKQLAVSIEGRRVQLWNLAAVRASFRELGIDWQD